MTERDLPAQHEFRRTLPIGESESQAGPIRARHRGSTGRSRPGLPELRATGSQSSLLRSRPARAPTPHNDGPQLAAALAAGKAGRCPAIVAKLDRLSRDVCVYRQTHLAACPVHRRRTWCRSRPVHVAPLRYPYRDAEKARRSGG